jgi:hypothetical protein
MLLVKLLLLPPLLLLPLLPLLTPGFALNVIDDAWTHLRGNAA